VALPQRLAQNGTFRRPGRIIAAFSQATTEENVPVIAQQSGTDSVSKAGLKLPSPFTGLKGGFDQVFERYLLLLILVLLSFRNISRWRGVT
jgi:hypothetical protein